MKKRILDILNKCESDPLQGRATRTEYLRVHLAALATGILVPAALYYPCGPKAAIAVGVLLLLSWFVKHVIVSVRRLHDLNLSGWLYLAMAPILPLAFLFLATCPGTKKTNRYDIQKIDIQKTVREEISNGDSPSDLNQSYQELRRLTLKTFGYLFMALLLITQIQWRPTIRNEQTFYVLEPAAENGEIDYRRAFLSPYNDAFYRPDNGYKRIMAALGVQSVSALKRGQSLDSPNYQPNPDWPSIARRFGIDPDQAAPFADFNLFEIENLDDLQVRPWKAAEHPKTTAWLQRFNPLLDEVKQAVQEQNYTPWIGFDKQGGALLDFNADAYCLQRGLAYGLQYRVLCRIESGAIEDAIDDIAALYGLSSSLLETPCLNCAYFGANISGRAEVMTRELILSGKASEGQLTRLDREIQKRTWKDPGPACAHSELLGVYDRVQTLFQGQAYRLYCKVPAQAEYSGNASIQAPLIEILKSQMIPFFFDENAFRTELAEQTLFLKMGAAARTTDACFTRLVLFDVQRDRNRAFFNSFSFLDALQYGATMRGRGLFLARLGGSMVLSEWETIPRLFLRLQSRRNLTRLALAVERYRLANGNYPKYLLQAAEFLKDGKNDSESVAEKKSQRTDDSDSLNLEAFPILPPIRYRVNKQSRSDWLKSQEAKRDADPSWKDPAYSRQDQPYYRPFLLYSFGPDGDDDCGTREADGSGEGDWIW